VTRYNKDEFPYELLRRLGADAAPGAPALLGHCRSVETDGD
jgi:hypothetical protein